jgi:hypothetical protein
MKLLSVLVITALTYATTVVACAPPNRDDNNNSPANRATPVNAASSSSSNETNTNEGSKTGGENSVSSSSGGVDVSASQVELRAQFKRVGDNQLMVHYEVVNRGATDVFLLNRLPSRGASGFSFGSGKYYLVAGADGVIEISKRAYFLPADSPASAAALALPAATRLRAGQTFSEEFAVSKPFQISHPYKDVANLPALPDNAEKVRFCLGVVQSAGQNVREEKLGGETLERLSASAIKNQQVVCSEVESIGAR